MNARMSSLRTRPSLPVAFTSARLILCSLAILQTAGVAGTITRPSDDGALVVSAATGGGGGGAAAFGGAALTAGGGGAGGSFVSRASSGSAMIGSGSAIMSLSPERFEKCMSNIHHPTTLSSFYT